MRILQVADGFPPIIGGVETYVDNLSRSLSQAGHEVVVATLAAAGLPNREEQGGVAIRRMTGVTQYLPGAGHDPGHYFHPPVPDPAIVWQLQALVDQFQPEVIHAHGWMMHSCLPLRRGPAALVVHLHEWGLSCVKKTMVTSSGTCLVGPAVSRCTSCAAEQYRGRARAGLLTVGLRAERPLYRRVDAFIATSTAVANVARNFLPRPELLTVVPNAVPDGLIEEAERTAPPAWLPDEDFMLFVGVLGPHKGLEVLLRAYRLATSRFRLVLLGTIRSDTPPIDEDVLVRHDVPHNEVMASWKRASIGVVPSLTESFGLVAVECQSVGTPVIASSTGGLVDIVQNEINGLVVPPGDVGALAKAIDRLASSPQLRSELGAAGAERAKQFAMSALLPRILEVYDQSSQRRARGTRKIAVQ